LKPVTMPWMTSTWSSTGMSSGWLMPTCSSDGFGKLYGEKLLPAGSRTTMATTTSAPRRTLSFSPMVAHPATSVSVLPRAALSASSSTAALLRAAGPGYEAQATNARRSINWPESTQVLPLRRPSTICWGFIFVPPVRTIV
jgi:hypothetical protein